MTLFSKSVILRDFNIWNDHLKLKEGLECAYKQTENNDCYATFTGTKEDINNKLSELNVLSDRARTLKSIPKYRIINSHKIRIQ